MSETTIPRCGYNVAATGYRAHGVRARWQLVGGDDGPVPMCKTHADRVSLSGNVGPGHPYAIVSIDATIPAPEAPAESITITLSAWEVASLSAWLDVTEPDHCGGEPGDEDHDEDGHGIEGSDCLGYCPGDIADLERIGDKMMQAARAAGW